MKQEYRQRSINKKDEGQVEWTSGLFFMLILAILMCTEFQLMTWQSTSAYMEDALAASNLASALIDVEEYGKTHKVLIKDVQGAYEVYLEAVRNNLGLNEQWICENQNIISGPIEIVTYIIYNVDGDAVETIRLGHDGQVLERQNGIKGNVMAPDGSYVENTGVYSQISFEVKGFWNVKIRAQKGKLVDVKKGAENEEG